MLPHPSNRTKNRYPIAGVSNDRDHDSRHPCFRGGRGDQGVGSRTPKLTSQEPDLPLDHRYTLPESASVCGPAHLRNPYSNRWRDTDLCRSRGRTRVRCPCARSVSTCPRSRSGWTVPTGLISRVRGTCGVRPGGWTARCASWAASSCRRPPAGHTRRPWHTPQASTTWVDPRVGAVGLDQASPATSVSSQAKGRPRGRPTGLSRQL